MNQTLNDWNLNESNLGDLNLKFSALIWSNCSDFAKALYWSSEHRQFWIENLKRPCNLPKKSLKVLRKFMSANLSSKLWKFKFPQVWHSYLEIFERVIDRPTVLTQSDRLRRTQNNSNRLRSTQTDQPDRRNQSAIQINPEQSKLKCLMVLRWLESTQSDFVLC